MQITSETTAIVIGGGGGIGRGTALGLAAKGARLVIADIEIDTAESVAAELVDRGAPAIAVRVDATDRDSLDALAARAEDRFGSIDVLSNNVGVVHSSALLDATEEEWGWVIEFNLMSIVRACAVIVPRIRAHGRGGHVVNTASMAALFASRPEDVGGVALGLYTTTKHAVLGYTETLRGELADDGIGVSCLCPGMVDSNLMATSLRNRPDRYGGAAEAPPTRGTIPHAMAQEAVGAYVVAGIEANRTQILTHPGQGRRLVETRAATLASDFDFFTDLGEHDVTDSIDVDHQDREWVRSRHEHYADLRRECPVVFNEHHGGFWMVTDYESVAAVARDNETFAHKYEPGAADGIDYHGICGIPRPPRTPRMGVSEIDGPEHADLRRVLNPYMVTKAVEANRPRMAQVSAWFIDQIIEAGEGDLIDDYATPVPGVMTLEMMGMPSTNWRHYADFFHATSSYKPSDTAFQDAVARVGDMWGELGDFARHCRLRPGDDLTSAIVGAKIGGRLLSDDEVIGILWNLVAGGLDTTTALVGWGLHHLGTHPEDRARLIADPSGIPAAVEEFLRHYSPSESLTRTATRDVELGGRQIKRGDVVFISWVSANHDSSVFHDADDVKIERTENKHLAFGLGGHRCIGSNIARLESELMIADVLARLPDYEVDPSLFRPYPGNLLMTGVVTMPVRFSPGIRSGVASPFD